MNLFTAYLKSNPPARSSQHANYRNSKKNADRQRKRRNQSKESNVEMPTTNPVIPTGRGPQPKSQAKTMESNPHSYLNHIGERTLHRMKTQEEEVQQTKAEDIITELDQQGAHMAYSKRPFTEEYIKTTVAAYLQESSGGHHLSQSQLYHTRCHIRKCSKSIGSSKPKICW